MCRIDMDLSLRILSLTFLAVAFCSSVISGQLFLQPDKKEHGYFTDESFFITCFASGASANQLKWLNKVDEEIVETVGRLHVQPASSEQPGLELVVEKVEMDDAGQYTCSDVETSKSFQLTVYRSISFHNTKKEQSAIEGQTADVLCNVTSTPSPVVNWHHDGSKLEDGPKYSIQTHNGEHHLIIDNAIRSDAGMYKCSAFAIGHLSSQTLAFDITFHVEYKPELIVEENDDEAYASLGSLANISCSANGQPAPVVIWYRGDSQIHNGSDYKILHSENESILQMKMESKSQFGTYTCIASNKIGDSEPKDILLKEGATPVAPIVEVSKEYEGNIYLSVKMPDDGYDNDDDNMHVSGYKVKYALKSDPSNSTKFQDFNTREEVVLKNISYNSEYVIQVAARNAAGHGDYSEEIIHETETFQKAPVTRDSGSISIRAYSTLLLVTFLVCM